MKLLIQIFCLYFLYLTGIPCQDAALNSCEGEVPVAQLNTFQDSDYDLGQENPDHHDDKDVCSPLCSCACCKIQLEITDTLIDCKEYNPFNKKETYFLEGHIEDAVPSIFQPPRV